jgi:hypothetical protein
MIRDYRGNMGSMQSGWGIQSMKVRLARPVAGLSILLLAMAGTLATAQTAYQPKFPGDPARSDSEAGALGYMRTVLRAQREYKKKHGAYATSLPALVNTGSFTKRMTNTSRGDYTVSFRSHKDGFELALTPQQLNAEHRSFYATEDGVIHGDDEKAADENSPKVK